MVHAAAGVAAVVVSCCVSGATGYHKFLPRAARRAAPASSRHPPPQCGLFGLPKGEDPNRLPQGADQGQLPQGAARPQLPRGRPNADERGRMMEALFEEGRPEDFIGNRRMAPSKDVPSHETIEFDEDGDPSLARFTYVDEDTCIGCTNCAHVARNTFFMEESLAGKARVFNQGRCGAGPRMRGTQPGMLACVCSCTMCLRVRSVCGHNAAQPSDSLSCSLAPPCHVSPSAALDARCGWCGSNLPSSDTDEDIEIAIDTCPVNCIHFVSHEDLVTLENERFGRENSLDFNNYASFKRSWTGQDAAVAETSATYYGSLAMGNRCTNCPSRGCAQCPMFGVGQNPIYLKRAKARELKRERSGAAAREAREREVQHRIEILYGKEGVEPSAQIDSAEASSVFDAIFGEEYSFGDLETPPQPAASSAMLADDAECAPTPSYPAPSCPAPSCPAPLPAHPLPHSQHMHVRPATCKLQPAACNMQHQTCPDAHVLRVHDCAAFASRARRLRVRAACHASLVLTRPHSRMLTPSHAVLACRSHIPSHTCVPALTSPPGRPPRSACERSSTTTRRWRRTWTRTRPSA